MPTNRGDEPDVLMGLFLFVWMGSLAVGFILNRRMTAPQKRTWFPRFTIALASFVVLFMSAMVLRHSGQASPMPLLFFLPCVVGAIAIVIIRQTKYCDKCNASHYNQNLWTPMKFCSRCGAPLDALKQKTDDDILA
jgi:CHASE2 domain-containing sensor protein